MVSTHWLRPFCRKSLPALALAAAAVFSACGAPAQGASSAAQTAESAVGLPNPIVECATLAELYDATDSLPMAAPADATEVRYSYIQSGSEHPVAQIDFTMDGTSCTLRGTRGDVENLAGVYEIATDGEKYSRSSAGQVATVKVQVYPSGLVADWRWGEITYSLYQQGEGEKIMGNGWYYAVNSCVQLTADTKEKNDWKDYLRADYENWETLDRYAEVKVGKIQLVPGGEQETVAVDTENISLVAYPITCKENQTWKDYLDNVPGALLAKTMLSYQYVKDSGETAQVTVTRYDLLCQGENGSYYAVDTLPV